MKEITRRDMYQPIDAVRSKKRPILPILLSVVFLLIMSFGIGYRASQYNWFQPAVKDITNVSLPDDLSYTSVEEVYDNLKSKFDGKLSEQALLDGIKTGLAKASGDNYTVYFNPDQTQEFYSDLNGSFEGIGAALGFEDNIVVVVTPIKGFPAEAAGLRAKDAIIKIDGNDAVGISVEEAVTKIRGPAGTDVTLTIVRDGEQIDITITRATITIPSVESKYLADGKIGYIQISRFAEDTSSLALRAAQDFKSNNVEGVILDVRNDGGGYVTAAVNVASLWLDKEVVFDQKSGGVSQGLHRANGAPLLNGIPTIVLINEGSASASEIVSGALKDNSVATIVGMKSFGKGSVQDLVNLKDGSTLKVTIARWYTPNGINIDKEGITPDVEVKFTDADFKNGTDSQLNKALEVIKTIQ